MAACATRGYPVTHGGIRTLITRAWESTPAHLGRCEARACGWFSVGLGAAEVVAPGAVARSSGRVAHADASRSSRRRRSQA